MRLADHYDWVPKRTKELESRNLLLAEQRALDFQLGHAYRAVLKHTPTDKRPELQANTQWLSRRRRNAQFYSGWVEFLKDLYNQTAYDLSNDKVTLIISNQRFTSVPCLPWATPRRGSVRRWCLAELPDM